MIRGSPVTGCIAFAILAAIVPAGARAQSPAPDPAALFDEGVRLCRDGQFAVALERFRAAQALLPHPTTLENIGRCAESGGEFVSALEAYEALLASDTPRTPRARRLQIAADVARLRARVGSLTISTPRAGASLRIDGRDLGSAPLSSPVRLTAGPHIVEVVLPGFEPGRAQVVVPGGGEVEVQVEVGPVIAPPAPPRPAAEVLVPVTLAAPASVRLAIDRSPFTGTVRVSPGRHLLVATGPAGSRLEAVVDLTEPGRRGRVRIHERFGVGWALAAAGVALAAGGVAGYSWWRALDAEDRYNDPATPGDDLARIREDALDAGHLTDVLVGVAGAATVAFVALGAVWAFDETSLAVEWQDRRP